MLTRYATIGELDGGDGDGGTYVDAEVLELVERVELVGLNDFCFWGVTLRRNGRKYTRRSG